MAAAPPLPAALSAPLEPNLRGEDGPPPLLDGPSGTQLGLPPKSGLPPRAFLPCLPPPSLSESRFRRPPRGGDGDLQHQFHFNSLHR